MTNEIKKPTPQTAFSSLTPATVVDLVEKTLNLRCTNLCRSLNSYINRVEELEQVDGNFLVAKFYRPGRWSKEALQDEHDFIAELAEQEIPVVAPLIPKNGNTLCSYQNMHFAIFPKKGGRSFDEFNDDQWLEIGRLLGRVHAIGAKRLPVDRITMAPERSVREHLEYIISGNFIVPELKGQFQELADALINEIKPLFDSTEMIRIHGDCHFSNLIYRPEESFNIIDFDDMAVGPPVQDLWMLLPGYIEDSLAEIDLFLEGYETFRNFDKRSLRLIEPLRAMRYIHYCAWCAHQVAEDGHSRVAPDFGTTAYWQREVRDLAEQLERIKSMPDYTGMF